MSVPSPSVKEDVEIHEEIQNMDIENQETPEVASETNEKTPVMEKQEPEIKAEPPKEVEKKDKHFNIKQIRFGPLSYRIVTQDQNGPCPLIAIANALILKGKLEVPANPSISAVYLLNWMINFISSRPPPEDEVDKQNYEKNFEDVLMILPKIVDGLDVNVQFSGVDKFEYTSESSLFDLVDIKLYHIWLPDPQFTVIYDLVSKLNYNELVEKMFQENDEAELLKSFHEDSISQATFIGLATLLAKMKDGEIAVLFHNNHFSTILKRRDEVFKLVTDVGYFDQPDVVWETLSSCDGDSIYVNGDFGNFRAAATENPAPARESNFEVVPSKPKQEAVEMAVEAMEKPVSPPSTSRISRSQTDQQIHAPQSARSLSDTHRTQSKDSKCVLM